MFGSWGRFDRFVGFLATRCVGGCIGGVRAREVDGIRRAGEILLYRGTVSMTETVAFAWRCLVVVVRRGNLFEALGSRRRVVLRRR